MTDILEAEDKRDRVYTSIRQAAACENITYATLRKAKQIGCPGFTKSGRLDFNLIAPWLVEHAPELEGADEDTKEHWAFRKLRADAQKAELVYEKEKGLYLTKDEVAAQLTALATATKLVLKSRLETELPQKIAGLDAIAIREVMRGTVDEICSVFQLGFERWN